MHTGDITKGSNQGVSETGVCTSRKNLCEDTFSGEDILIVKDNFIRESGFYSFNRDIKEADFAGVEYFGDFYPGVSPVSNESMCYVHESLRDLGFDEIDNCASFIRLELEGSQPTSWIHADTLCASKYSVVGYMNDIKDVFGGTAFWNHKIVGPTNGPYKDNPVSQQFLRRDAHTQDAWRLTDLVGYKKNRAVIFPSDRFHSRYPRESFGTTKEDGRLLFVMFFNAKFERSQ